MIRWIVAVMSAAFAFLLLTACDSNGPTPPGVTTSSTTWDYTSADLRSDYSDDFREDWGSCLWTEKYPSIEKCLYHRDVTIGQIQDASERMQPTTQPSIDLRKLIAAWETDYASWQTANCGGSSFYLDVCSSTETNLSETWSTLRQSIFGFS